VNVFLRGFVTAAVELEVGMKARIFVLDASDARGMLTDADTFESLHLDPLP
jgi:hypothetical protein